MEAFPFLTAVNLNHTSSLALPETPLQASACKYSVAPSVVAFTRATSTLNAPSQSSFTGGAGAAIVLKYVALDLQAVLAVSASITGLI